MQGKIAIGVTEEACKWIASALYYQVLGYQYTAATKSCMIVQSGSGQKLSYVPKTNPSVITDTPIDPATVTPDIGIKLPTGFESVFLGATCWDKDLAWNPCGNNATPPWGCPNNPDSPWNKGKASSCESKDAKNAGTTQKDYASCAATCTTGCSGFVWVFAAAGTPNCYLKTTIDVASKFPMRTQNQAIFIKKGHVAPKKPK